MSRLLIFLFLYGIMSLVACSELEEDRRKRAALADSIKAEDSVAARVLLDTIQTRLQPYDSLSDTLISIPENNLP